MLHNNALDGDLPSFEAYSKLKTLTLFEQDLYGRLSLPSEAPNLDLVMVTKYLVSHLVQMQTRHKVYMVQVGLDIQ